MYFDRKCKVTFICHGATIFSEEHRFSDIENYPPLSDLGQEEMERISNYLRRRGVKNDAIYTSPSMRTLQSAQMITKLYKKDYIILEDLNPRKCGKLNGLSLEHLQNKHLDYLDIWFNKLEYDSDIEAEGISDFINRVKVVIDRVVSENIGNRIIIVTHPEVIQAAICAALDIPYDKIAKIFIRTGSATQISYYENWASLLYSDYTPLN